jgi:parallel beta-helix repeat protein
MCTVFKSWFGFVLLAGCGVVLSLSAPSFQRSGYEDRYVSPGGSDANQGSAAQPWRTIKHAASAVRPGMIVHVAPGHYLGSVVTSASGQAGARIRFISDEKWAAHIIGDPAAEAIWQNRGDYVDILGFDISGASPNGIETLGSFTRIIGNRVGPIAASCDENGGAGINSGNYEAHDTEAIANLVHDVRALPGCSRQHGVGIYHSNARGGIFNNIVFRNGTMGIQLWHAATGVTVANNTVFSNGETGIVIGAGDSPGGVVNDHTVVANNISVGNGVYGIQEFGFTGPLNSYINNLVFENRRGDVHLLKGSARGTIVAAPQFVKFTGDADGDYHPGPASVAVDSASAQHAPDRDFQGGDRPFGRAADIGAYERGAAPGKWPDSWIPQ